MHGAALIRLRAGFVVLGALLLLPLGLLVREAEARFEEQRRLRHEIVAERIFDEMERELTLLLESEGGRPSSAYDAHYTQVSTWSPWVVGYFAYDGKELRLPAREQLATERARRVEQAFARVSEDGALSALLRPASDDRSADAARSDAVERLQTRAPAKTSAGAPKPEKKQEAVLRQLNRASAEREQKKKARRKREPAPRDAYNDDPLSGLE